MESGGSKGSFGTQAGEVKTMLTMRSGVQVPKLPSERRTPRLMDVWDGVPDSGLDVVAAEDIRPISSTSAFSIAGKLKPSLSPDFRVISTL